MNQLNSHDEKNIVNQLLKEDPAADMFDDAYFDQLHDKIMARVENLPIKKPTRIDKMKVYLRSHYRSWLYGSGMSISMLSLFLVAFQLVDQVKSTTLTMLDSRRGEKQIIANVKAQDMIEAQTLMGYQAESDFFVDVAALSDENLDIEQLKQAMGKNEVKASLKN